MHLALVLRSLDKQPVFEATCREKNPLCCCTEWRLLTVLLQTQPARLFRGEEHTYHTLQSHCLAAIVIKPSSITPEPQCLWQLSTEEPSIGKHQNVHSQMNGYGRRPTYIQKHQENHASSSALIALSDDHTDSRKSDRKMNSIHNSVQAESKSITNKPIYPTDKDCQTETSN